jgi:2,3-bisphosphoglycerate-dependent phosphoglycerate mutase
LCHPPCGVDCKPIDPRGQVTEFLLIRHGETDWNRALRFQGQIDVALNELGQLQASRLARHLLRSEWADADQLHCSDLQRAVQTAVPISSPLRPLQPQAELREQGFGIFEGKSVSELQQEMPELWHRWRRFEADFELPGGESTRRFHARVMAHLTQLAQHHDGQRLLIVTHGGVLDMLWRTVHQLDLSGYRQCQIPNAGINHVVYQQGAWHILDWARADHLAGLPPQPVYQTTSA